MNNAKVNKSIKKVMQKLVGFVLKYPELKASAELKSKHNSIWVQSYEAKHKIEECLGGNYLGIFHIPKAESEIEQFEKLIEDAIAHLHNENLKLKAKEI